MWVNSDYSIIWDEKGETNLMFQIYLSHKRSGDILNMLLETGKIEKYFSMPVSDPINSLNITYMNSFQNLICDKEGYQMSL